MNKRVLTAAMIGTALAANLSAPALATDFRVTLPASGIDASNDGRIILVITPDDTKEPRFQVKLGADAPQVFGIKLGHDL
jgi:F420-0:gamma-glutamyl ligase